MSMQYFHHVTHSKAFTDSYALYTLTVSIHFPLNKLINIL